MAPISSPNCASDEGGVGEDARVVLRRLERLPSKIDGLAAVRLRRFGPAVMTSRRWQIAAKESAGP